MERLTANIEGKTEMICRFEDCMTDEDICPRTNERDCPCMQAVIEKLAQYEDAEERGNGWIPCSERLPEESLQSVIGWDTYRERCCFVQYVGGRFVLGDDTESVKITHWMNVPYQPNGERMKKTNFDRCCESMEAMAHVIDIAKIGWTKDQIMEWLQKEACEIPEPYSKDLAGDSITNADRIRSMSDEELAEYLLNSCENPMMEINEDICDFCDIYESEIKCDEDYCKKAILKWLQSEVEE